MNQKPYSSYHGRKSLIQRILTGIAILLAVVLLLAVVAWFALPNFLVYDGETIQLDLGWLKLGKGQDAQTAQPSQSGDEAVESEFVIVEPDPTPSAAPAKVDLAFYERRDVPRGLVSMAQGGSPAQGQGAIVDMTGEVLTGNGDLAEGREAAREENARLAYAAAWLAPDWATALEDEKFADNLVQRCLLLADMGYDEILFDQAVPEGDGADLARLYREAKAALDKAGWQGRLGLVLEQSLVGDRYDEDLIPAIAQSFDRLYFRRAMQNNVNAALTRAGFSAAPSDIVTVYATVPTVNWAWAVLPQ